MILTCVEYTANKISSHLSLCMTSASFTHVGSHIFFKLPLVLHEIKLRTPALEYRYACSTINLMSNQKMRTISINSIKNSYPLH